MINVTLIPILSDNYAYLLEGDNGEVAVVDPGDAAPIIATLEARGVQLDYILNTHHHGDHIHGNQALKERYDATIIGPAAEMDKIANLDVALNGGDDFVFDDERFQIISTPGHTMGHICFYGAQNGILFAGDTLFAMGCGRLFEGSAEDMFLSFQKLSALPDDTQIYAGHEYTLSNAVFCASAEPYNEDIQNRLEAVKAMRSNDVPTLPSTMALEKQTNVFLRAKTAQEFSALRLAKDSF